MQLTKRDTDVLKFILDMKFACVPEIHEMFFKNKIGGGESKSLWYARERLRLLVVNDFLKVERFRVDGKNYYIATKYCFEYMMGNFLNSDVAMPPATIDIRTFEHDKELIKFRIFLEKTGQIAKWRSERFLKKEHYHFTGRLRRIVAPDAIYEEHGKKIAFEYEVARKSEGRYREKIKRYIQIIRDREKIDPISFEHCRFVCKNPQVYNSLMNLTKFYREMFSVEMADSFFNANAMVIPINKQSDSQEHTGI